MAWERRFVSAGLRERRAHAPKERRHWTSTIVDVIQFGLPTVLAVGLPIDGIASGIISYGQPWSFSLPLAVACQVLGAVLLFIGVPAFTAAPGLTEKYVYSTLAHDGPLRNQAPHRSVLPSYS